MVPLPALKVEEPSVEVGGAEHAASAEAWSLILWGVFAYTEEVSVMGGDSVTLNTGVQTHQQDLIRWYYNGIHIALITGDQREICTDVQCKEGNEVNKVTERFRGRLKLDHQTGSLTIMNIRTRHSGEYTLMMINGSSFSEKIFIVSVHGVNRVSVSVMEGDPVTLNTGVQTNQQEKIKWYFNKTLIALITRDLSYVCTDVQCNKVKVTERFRDRLKLDHQTGSLIIMNIRNRHSGNYTLVIISISSEKIFSVSVTALPDAGIYAVVAVPVILQIVSVIYFCKCRARRNEANRTERDNQESRAEDSPPDQRETLFSDEESQRLEPI
ncbi:unnamed protein product [Leuciscus chuanchicus]